MSGYSRSKGVNAGDAHRARRLVAQFGQRVELGFDLFEAMAYRLRQSLAGRRRRYATCGAREQANLQAPLKPSDGLAQRRLRHPERGSSAGEAAFARYGDERQQIVEVASCHCRVAY